MHLLFGLRGIKHERDLFVSMIQGQMCQWKRKNLKTNEEEITGVQLSLRPLELFEVVFPEECLPDVLKTLGLNKSNKFDGANAGKKKTEKFLQNKSRFLRKIMGLKEIPQVESDPKNPKIFPGFVNLRGISIHPIGLKHDERREIDWGELGKYEQEML